MSSSVSADFRISVVMAIIVDKLVLAKDDAWAMAAHSSNKKHQPFLSTLLWSMPLLGSSQLMVGNFQMGEPRAYGIIVGDGQEVSAINSLLGEWLFKRRTIPSGTCIFGKLTYGGFTRGYQRSDNSRYSSHWPESLSMAGLPITTLVLVFLGTMSSMSYLLPLFFFFLYVATFLSNYYLALQSQNAWAGFTGDAEEVQILIIAPGDRWAALSGPRNLIKIITTGSHVDQHPSVIKHAGQYILVAVLLSTGFLQQATLLDGVYAGCGLGFVTAAAWARAEIFGRNTTIRGVRVSYVRRTIYKRRADLIEELSRIGKSDAWAYDSKLLTRRFVSGNTSAVVRDD